MLTYGSISYLGACVYLTPVIARLSVGSAIVMFMSDDCRRYV